MIVPASVSTLKPSSCLKYVLPLYSPNTILHGMSQTYLILLNSCVVLHNMAMLWFTERILC